MRTYASDLTAACLLLTFTRVDGTVERITTASNDVVIDGDTWSKFPGLRVGVRTSRNDGTPPTVGFSAQLGSASPLKFRDVDRGKYERARVQIHVANQTGATTKDFEFDGEIRGGVAYDMHGMAAFDLISRFSIPRDIFVPTYTLLCRHSFADRRTCGAGPDAPATFPYVLGGDLADVSRNETIAVSDRRRFRFASGGIPSDYANVYLEATTAGATAGSAPSFSSTVGATTVDGGVTWTTRDALARSARIIAADNRTITLDALPDPRASDSTWYRPCKILFSSGEYAGQCFKGSNWNPGNLTVQTYLACPFAAVDDWVEIAPDCDKTHATCLNKYSNTENHGGFPFQLGAKYQSQQMALT